MLLLELIALFLFRTLLSVDESLLFILVAMECLLQLLMLLLLALSYVTRIGDTGGANATKHSAEVGQMTIWYLVYGFCRGCSDEPCSFSDVRQTS